MRRPSVRRPARHAALARAGAVPVALLLSVTLASCTVGGADPAPTGASVTGADAGPTATATAAASPTGTEASGPSPEELSAQVLDAAGGLETAGQPVASQTVAVQAAASETSPTVDLTVDVMGLRRVAGATLLTLRLSSPSVARIDQANAFALGGPVQQHYVPTFWLQDPGAGVRHVPLSWRREVNRDLSDPAAGPFNSCVCLYNGGFFTLAPDPILVDVMYGALPAETTSIDVVVADVMTFPAVPVTG